MNTGKVSCGVVGGAKGFVGGFFSLWDAFCFVMKNPSLYKFVIIPFVINILVFIGVVYWGYDLFNQLVGEYLSPHDSWYWQILAMIIKFIAGLATMVAVFFTFTVVGNLIAAPFNDILSERTEQLLTGHMSDEPFSLKRIVKDLWRVMRDEIRKMLIFVVLMIVALLFNLLPGVGSLIYTIISGGLMLYFLIIEYTGYVFSRKHQGFKEQRLFIASNRLSSLGFALAVMCMLFIPFVQFLTIPMAVVAATQLCCCDCI